MICFTIKASGDFTARIGEFHPGNWATVDGPYGLFSHLVRAPWSEPLIMIAGGVGITPILSMLRHMAATGDDRPVTLIWGNRREDDIVYRKELEALADGPMNLRIHHVLSEQESWPGLTGFVDAPLLGRARANCCFIVFTSAGGLARTTGRRRRGRLPGNLNGLPL